MEPVPENAEVDSRNVRFRRAWEIFPGGRNVRNINDLAAFWCHPDGRALSFLLIRHCAGHSGGFP
jgi:hypothetical protein